MGGNNSMELGRYSLQVAPQVRNASVKYSGNAKLSFYVGDIAELRRLEFAGFVMFLISRKLAGKTLSRIF